MDDQTDMNVVKPPAPSEVGSDARELIRDWEFLFWAFLLFGLARLAWLYLYQPENKGFHLGLVCWFSWYVAHERYNLTNRQIAEVVCYLALGGLAIAGSAILIATARSRREKAWPHPPMVVSRKRDEQFTSEAWKQETA